MTKTTDIRYIIYQRLCLKVLSRLQDLGTSHVDPLTSVVAGESLPPTSSSPLPVTPELWYLPPNGPSVILETGILSKLFRYVLVLFTVECMLPPAIYGGSP